MRDGLHLIGKGAAVFADEFLNIFVNKHCLN